MPDLCDCFIFDPLWWKDYGIPLLEAVAIPLLVWFLTWYYGAEKAEERKEKRELRDNLNLLLSVCLLSIQKTVLYRKERLRINEIEVKDQEEKVENALDELSKIFFMQSDFSLIDAAKYASCIKYDDNFMVTLITAKNALDLLIVKIEHRNNKIKHITNCEDKVMKENYELELVGLDLRSFEENMQHADNTIRVLKYLSDSIKNLETKIKDLKLDTIKYSEEQQQLFAELEQKYAKEQEK